jgi:hypothetical protein
MVGNEDSGSVTLNPMIEEGTPLQKADDRYVVETNFTALLFAINVKNTPFILYVKRKVGNPVASCSRQWQLVEYK